MLHPDSNRIPKKMGETGFRKSIGSPYAARPLVSLCGCWDWWEGGSREAESSVRVPCRPPAPPAPHAVYRWHQRAYSPIFTINNRTAGFSHCSAVISKLCMLSPWRPRIPSNSLWLGIKEQPQLCQQRDVRVRSAVTSPTMKTFQGPFPLRTLAQGYSPRKGFLHPASCV